MMISIASHFAATFKKQRSQVPKQKPLQEAKNNKKSKISKKVKKKEQESMFPSAKKDHPRQN